MKVLRVIWSSILWAIICVVYQIILDFILKNFINTNENNFYIILYLTLNTFLLIILKVYLNKNIFNMNIKSKSIKEILKNLQLTSKYLLINACIGLIFISIVVRIDIVRSYFENNINMLLKDKDGVLGDINISANIIMCEILGVSFEELFFRKTIFSYYKDKISIKRIILISSISFAIIHTPSTITAIIGCWVGVLCCILYLKTKSLIYPILLHFGNNMSGVIANIYINISLENVDILKNTSDRYLLMFIEGFILYILLTLFLISYYKYKK